MCLKKVQNAGKFSVEISTSGSSYTSKGVGENYFLCQDQMFHFSFITHSMSGKSDLNWRNFLSVSAPRPCRAKTRDGCRNNSSLFLPAVNCPARSCVLVILEQWWEFSRKILQIETQLSLVWFGHCLTQLRFQWRIKRTLLCPKTCS